MLFALLLGLTANMSAVLAVAVTIHHLLALCTVERCVRDHVPACSEQGKNW